MTDLAACSYPGCPDTRLLLPFNEDTLVCPLHFAALYEGVEKGKSLEEVVKKADGIGLEAIMVGYLAASRIYGPDAVRHNLKQALEPERGNKLCVCGQPVRAGKPWGRFCSSTCRWREWKKKGRKRHEEE